MVSLYKTRNFVFFTQRELDRLCWDRFGTYLVTYLLQLRLKCSEKC